MKKLRESLLENAIRLEQAAETVCTDKSFVYDTVYSAVVKTKQKYKKLVNKDRAVDVCFSLMKQPRKHVNQNFSSVEDCIEKAMAAKIVPWKPIISAVAVVLAAAILIPHLLPGAGTTYVDPSGFVMENTLALKNQVSGNNILLQNLHHPTDLGTENETSLIGVPWSPVIQNIKYDCITTTKGETFLVATYVSTNEKNHEFILYKAESTGWIEIGREMVKVVTKIHLGQTSYGSTPSILLSDEDGNVYIVSLYDEGVQIHTYDTKGKFSTLGRVWISENATFPEALPGATVTMMSNNWCSSFFASINNKTGVIEIFMELREGGLKFKHCSVTYDLSDRSFSNPIHLNEKVGQITDCTFSQAKTFFVSKLIPVSEEPTQPIYSHYLYSMQQGEIVNKVEIASGPATGNRSVKVYLLEANGDKLHLVYSQQNKYYHVVYQDGVEVERYRFYALSTDPIEYMTFFLYNDTPHYLASVNKEYLLVARIVEGKAEKIGEFVMPFFFLGTEYDIRRFTPVLSGGNVVNYLINGCEDTVQIYTMPTTYFFQIILEQEDSDK